jgi:Protein of unknown function (DUF3987)
MTILQSEIPLPQQVVAHLRALGYGESTPVYLRCFPEGKGGARNLQGTLADFPWAELQPLQRQGYGVYFVANGQGHKDADVDEGRLIFFEHDDLEKSLQQDLWRGLGLPEPTVQVDTGGKSIHSYWRLEPGCPISEWRELQADLLEFADADRSIKNPSRVMRLAGFRHQGTGQMATLVSSSGQGYAFSNLRALIPCRQSPSREHLAVPLEVCLTRDDRALIQSGAPQGQRNTCGAKLARNLIGTEGYLQQEGQRYEGSAQQLFSSYCSRCQPPIADQEMARIWQSAASDQPTPSLTAEAITNCLSAWQQQKAPQTKPPPSNVVPLRPSLTPTGTSEKIKALLQQGLSATKLQAERISLRAQTTIPEREFNDLWQASDRELQQQESRDETKTDLDNLLEIGRYELGLKGILPDELAVLLERQTTLLGSTPAAMLLTLLPIIASLARVGTKLELIQATGFYALPILYTGIVCESGGAKSPTQKTILRPLLELQAEADRDHHHQLQDWEALPPEASKKPPLPREYVTQDVTREAIALIQSQQPDRGFIGWLDELSAIIGSQNQYRNGRGTDREALLTGRDGTGIKVNRASGKRIVSPISAYSITGGTQPDTLRHLMGDFSDGSGQWARFLWCLMPIKRTPYPEPEDASISAQITAKLFQAYRRVEGFAPVTYRLTPAAQDLYHEWYDALDERRVQESRQSLRSVYAKAKGNTGELALLLHLTNAAVAEVEPAPQIAVETLQAAIRVMKFCLGQVRLIHGLGDEIAGALPPLLAKIIELSGRKGWITARDAKNGIRGLKAMAPDRIRDLFSELVEMGHGEMTGAGIKVKFQAKAVDGVDTGRQGMSTARTPAYQALQETVDTVDRVLCSSTNLVAPLSFMNPRTDSVSTVSAAVDGVDTGRQPLSTARMPAYQSLQKTVDTVDIDFSRYINLVAPQPFLNPEIDSVSTAPAASTVPAESFTSPSFQPISAVSTRRLPLSTGEALPVAQCTASTVSTASTDTAESPTGPDFQSINPVSTACLRLSTDAVLPVAQCTASTVSTPSTVTAESFTGHSFQSNNAASTPCLQLSTGADANPGQHSVDPAEWAVGERVTVKSSGTWQPATLTAIPNHHPNPQHRFSGWKAQLDMGQETYCWSAQDIQPLAAH